MNDQPKPDGQEERPQVFKVDREAKEWKFTRRGLLAAAVGLAASAAMRSRILAGPVRALDGAVRDSETGEETMQLQPGQHVHYTWRVQNVGAAPWGLDTSLRLVDAGNWQMPDNIPLPDAAPGEVVTITVEAIVPEEASAANSEWELVGSPNTTHKLFLPLILSNAKGTTPCPTHIIACPANVVICPAFKMPTPTATPCPAHIVACPAFIVACPAHIIACPAFAVPTPTATPCPSHIVACPSNLITCPAFNTCPTHIVGCPAHIVGCPIDFGCLVDFGCPVDFFSQPTK